MLKYFYLREKGQIYKLNFRTSAHANGGDYYFDTTEHNYMAISTPSPAHQLILFGSPGTGKSHRVNNDLKTRLWVFVCSPN